MDRSHANAVTLLGGTIDPVNHRRCQATFEGFGLARPIRISASNHHRTISSRHRDQFLWVRFPPLDIQHTVSDILINAEYSIFFRTTLIISYRDSMLTE